MGMRVCVQRSYKQMNGSVLRCYERRAQNFVGRVASSRMSHLTSPAIGWMH